MKLELFNDKAHVRLSSVIDDFEDWLVKQSRCKAKDANDHAALFYISTVGDILTHGQAYLESEECIGADIFLWYIMKDRKVRSLGRDARLCAKQLASHTPIYFPNYLKLLRIACLEVLSRETEPLHIAWNGIVMLGAASLPGMRNDVRRTLRRMGVSFDRAIVSDDITSRRIGGDGTIGLLDRRLIELSTWRRRVE